MSDWNDDYDRNATATRERTTNPLEEEIEESRLPVVASAPGAALSGEFDMARQMAAGVVRDRAAKIKAAKAIGELMAFDALYSFPVGGKRVEGATVWFAEALAQEWGHLLYGTRIQSVDGDRVLLLSVCADCVTGVVATRPAMVTLPPASGKFAKNAENTARWEAMQVQNAVSKAVRGVLLHAMPKWFVRAGEEAARAILCGAALGYHKGPDGKDNYDRPKTLVEVRAECLAAFAKAGIPQKDVEAFLGGVPVELWTVSDISDLRAGFAKFKRGELSREAFRAATPEPAPAGRTITKPAGSVLDAELGGGTPTAEEQAEILRREAEEAGRERGAK